jgi:hypothetical protein
MLARLKVIGKLAAIYGAGNVGNNRLLGQTGTCFTNRMKAAFTSTP